MDVKRKEAIKGLNYVLDKARKATLKGAKWSAQKAWEHREHIAGGIIGSAKGLYHMGQNVYGLTIDKVNFKKQLTKLKEQGLEFDKLSKELKNRFSDKELIIDSLGISASMSYGYYNIDYIPEEVERAYELAYPIKSQSENLRDIIQCGDDEELLGIMNGIKGKLFEIRYVDYLNDGNLPDGYEAVLADSAINPGWDIAIVGENGDVINELQLKATDSASYVKAALEKYPSIEIVTTEEVYDAIMMGEFADHVINSGISNEELTEVVSSALDNDAIQMDLGLPVIPMLIIGYSVYKKEHLTQFEQGREFGDRYMQSYITYIAGGAVAVLTNTWWIGLLASLSTKIACSLGRQKFNRNRALVETIKKNDLILKKMKAKLA